MLKNYWEINFIFLNVKNIFTGKNYFRNTRREGYVLNFINIPGIIMKINN